MKKSQYRPRVCVVGAGYWGKNHIRTLKDLNALGAIVEPNLDNLKSIISKYPDVKIFKSIDDALEDPNLNAYTIATPAETHFEIAKKIISSKKNILIEKPFTLNIKDAKDLVHLSNTNSTTLMVGHLMLFHPAIIKIKSMIDEGKIGKVQYLYSNRLNYGKVRTEEDAFWSLAPHDISIFQYITNEFPSEILAHGSKILQKRICDSTITKLKYKNGIEGHIFVSWLHPFKEHRLVIIGSEAMITFEDSVEEKPLKLFSKRYEMAGANPIKHDGPVEAIEYNMREPLREELAYFLALKNGKNPHIADGKHALDVIKILVEASNQLEKDSV